MNWLAINSQCYSNFDSDSDSDSDSGLVSVSVWIKDILDGVGTRLHYYIPDGGKSVLSLARVRSDCSIDGHRTECCCITSHSVPVSGWRGLATTGLLYHILNQWKKRCRHYYAEVLVFHSFQTGSGAHPASYPIGPRDSLTGVNSAGVLRLKYKETLGNCFILEFSYEDIPKEYNVIHWNLP
jgi:hypothetical protein